MSFVFRVVLILLIFAFVVYVFKALARLSHNLRYTVKEVNKMREQQGRAGTRDSIRSMKMVRCAACGSFIAERDAMQISSRGKSQNFCSTNCIQIHAKSA
ncbi:MAG TPA: hypothetical protein VEF04_17970 [Blastocatellia bacterium]|nr:hypothetical protein [Blastocatellia bacterium]